MTVLLRSVWSPIVVTVVHATIVIVIAIVVVKFIIIAIVIVYTVQASPLPMPLPFVVMFYLSSSLLLSLFSTRLLALLMLSLILL